MRLRAFERLGDWYVEHQSWLVLAFVVMVAVGLRVWQLDVLPPGLHLREARDGLEALALLQDGLRGGGLSAGPYQYLLAASHMWLGNTALALRLVPALLGVASVLATYMAAAQWFRQRVALLAALFVAVSPWALHVNRLSEPLVLGMVFTPLLLWLFGKALRTDFARWYVLLGVTLGAIAYTQVPYYVVMTALGLLAVASWRRYRRELFQHRHAMVIVALSAILAALPLLLYVVFTQDVSPLEHHAFPPIPAGEVTALAMGFGEALRDTLAMLHFAGSDNDALNLAGEPQLTPVVGVLSGLGVLLAIWRRHEARYRVLVVLLAASLLPSVLAYETAPDITTTVLAIPVIAILAAVGLSELYSRWRGVFPRNLLARYVGLSAIGVTLILTGSLVWERYFIAWANTPATFEAYQEQTKYAADRVAASQTVSWYIVAEPEQHPVLEYRLWQEDEWEIVGTEEVSGFDLGADRNRLLWLPSEAAHVPEGLEPTETRTSALRPHTIMYHVYEPE